MNRGKDFFIPYMDRLAGTAKFREQILQGINRKANPAELATGSG